MSINHKSGKKKLIKANFQDSYKYENNFYLTAQAHRMARIIAHYELYKMTTNLRGDIVECGVFKGASLMQFIMFMQIFEAGSDRKIIGFDTYGEFPDTNIAKDKNERQMFLDETKGGVSITKKELEKYILKKQFSKFKLIKGDINNTVPKFVTDYPNLEISLLNIDTDIFEPCKTILEHLAPKVVPGGVIIFDDYGIFSGETKLANEYCKKYGYKLMKLPFSKVPSYLVKL